MNKSKPKLSFGVEDIMSLTTQIGELKELLRIAYYNQTEYMSEYAREQYCRRVKQILDK